ncbi:uncharacterized protein TNCV_1427981 [Trichonephila clavipes]|nr:uncharacterized protein TNCV_1427981 [Trichonephila clavipes]
MTSSPSTNGDHHVEGLMHAKSIVAQSSTFDIVWYFGEEVPAQMSSSSLDRARGRSVSCELDNPWLTVRKILRYILKWYPYNIHVMQTLKPQDQKTHLADFWNDNVCKPLLFMQDGATPHIGRQVKALLSANIGANHVVSRHFPDVWPSRSPDLNPCGF